MLELILLVKQSTLRAIAEHSVLEVAGGMPINNTESLVLFTADTVQRLLDLARPEDTRIDDVIMRQVL